MPNRLTDIRLRRSSVPNRIPGTSDLSAGELAMNTADGALYFKKSVTTGSGENEVTTESIITAHDDTIMHIDSTNSRIGINTAAPDETLEITGNAKIVGELKLGVGGSGASVGTVVIPNGLSTTNGAENIDDVLAITAFNNTSNTYTASWVNTGTDIDPKPRATLPSGDNSISSSLKLIKILRVTLSAVGESYKALLTNSLTETDDNDDGISQSYISIRQTDAFGNDPEISLQTTNTEQADSSNFQVYYSFNLVQNTNPTTVDIYASVNGTSIGAEVFLEAQTVSDTSNVGVTWTNAPAESDYIDYGDFLSLSGVNSGIGTVTYNHTSRSQRWGSLFGTNPGVVITNGGSDKSDISVITPGEGFLRNDGGATGGTYSYTYDLIPESVSTDITIGRTDSTGTISIGRSIDDETINIGTGANAASKTKAINIGTGGAQNSITNISIGPSGIGRNTSVTIGNPHAVGTNTVTLNGIVTSNGLFKVDDEIQLLSSGYGSDLTTSIKSDNTNSSASWVYADETYDFTNEEVIPNAVWIGDSGTKMYIMGAGGDDINQYALGTAYDISTASFTQTDASGYGGNPQGMWFSSDGTQLVTVDTGSDQVRSFTLSTGWDISTRSSLVVARDFTTNVDENPTGVFFGDSGNKVFFVGSDGVNGDGDIIYSYDLSSAYDISTISTSTSGGNNANAPDAKVLFSSFNSVLPDPITLVNDLSFTSDGKTVHIVCKDRDGVISFSLSTAWDISTMSYNGALNHYMRDTNVTGIYTDYENNIAVLVGQENDTVYRYTVDNSAIIVDAKSTQFKGKINAHDDALVEGELFVSGKFRSSGGAHFNGAINTLANVNLTGGGSVTYKIGSTDGTGDISIGRSTVSQTLNIGDGATASGSTNEINIGTEGLAGATTTITLGSTASTSATTINNKLDLQGKIHKYNNANPTDGQLLIGNTANANFQVGTIAVTTNTGLAEPTLGAGTITLAGLDSGTEATLDAVSVEVSPGDYVEGVTYTITDPGNTNWTSAYGASSNAVGTTFTGPATDSVTTNGTAISSGNNFSVSDGTNNSKGVASFASEQFTVTSGHVVVTEIDGGSF